MKYIFFSGLLCISSCMVKKPIDNNLINGNWRLYSVTTKEGEGADFAMEAGMSNYLKEGAVISFFKDGSYSDINATDGFVTGGWSLDGKNAEIRLNNRGANASMKIVIDKVGKKTVYVLSRPGGNYLFRYIKQTEPLKNFKEDPLYKENNEWRIKAIQYEDPGKLKQRLANYFKHMALLLKAVKERKQEIVSFEFSPGPVKVYNGAIGIYPYKIVPQAWKSAFYNDSSALAGYEFYRHYLNTNYYRGASTGDWINDDYRILLSIYNDIRQSAKLPG